jgi:hypothetical protein
MNNITCKHCNNSFNKTSALNYHQKNARYCLIKQGKIEEKKEDDNIIIHKCNFCEKILSTKHTYNSHLLICKAKNKQNEESLHVLSKEHIKIVEQQYKEQISEYKEQIKELQNKIERMATKAIEKPTNQTNLFRVPNFENETIIDIEEDDDDDDDDEENKHDSMYKNMKLELNREFSIENREEDGYINVTNLCKAGGKQFKSWNRLDKTRAFLQVLSTSVKIHTDLLIKMNTGGLNEDRKTWVHPQVAINIAQWISPSFDVKVSAWIYEVMMTGRVDITNTKSYRQLQEENNIKELKINYLTKKYIKKQPRKEFEERYVVYILTTPSLKKDRRYILGKAENLTNRLSTYNKTDEHEVVYYQSCTDEDSMKTVENLVFQKLKEYREQANRERFILPEDKDVDLFIDEIKKSIEFISNK